MEPQYGEKQILVGIDGVVLCGNSLRADCEAEILVILGSVLLRVSYKELLKSPPKISSSKMLSRAWKATRVKCRWLVLERLTRNSYTKYDCASLSSVLPGFVGPLRHRQSVD